MIYLRMYLTVSGRWPQTKETTDQKHIWNWRMAEGFHWIFKDSLKEEVRNYKIQRPSHSQPHSTYSKDNSEEAKNKVWKESWGCTWWRSFRLEKSKAARNAVVMLRVISEHTLELRASFKNWQKAFDRVNWTKLMQILEETDIDWRRRGWPCNWTWIRELKHDWTNGRREVRIW